MAYKEPAWDDYRDRCGYIEWEECSYLARHYCDRCGVGFCKRHLAAHDTVNRLRPRCESWQARRAEGEAGCVEDFDSGCEQLCDDWADDECRGTRTVCPECKVPLCDVHMVSHRKPSTTITHCDMWVQEAEWYVEQMASL